MVDSATETAVVVATAVAERTAVYKETESSVNFQMTLDANAAIATQSAVDIGIKRDEATRLAGEALSQAASTATSVAAETSTAVFAGTPRARATEVAATQAAKNQEDTKDVRMASGFLLAGMVFALVAGVIGYIIVNVWTQYRKSKEHIERERLATLVYIEQKKRETEFAIEQMRLRAEIELAKSRVWYPPGSPHAYIAEIGGGIKVAGLIESATREVARDQGESKLRFDGNADRERIARFLMACAEAASDAAAYIPDDRFLKDISTGERAVCVKMLTAHLDVRRGAPSNGERSAGFHSRTIIRDGRCIGDLIRMNIEGRLTIVTVIEEAPLLQEIGQNGQ